VPDAGNDSNIYHSFKTIHGERWSCQIPVVTLILSGRLGAENVFFTQWFAAHLRHPYTTPPLVSAYVKRKPLQEFTWARQVDNGGNLWLITPKDEGVFQETQTAHHFTLVSDVQIYLDLLQVEQRGPEQANALREWKGFAK
jgi:Transcriptional regulator, AbiEi antitoxin, Type IV TA system